MADIKISEIANKASISDLSNSRYIVSVPSADNTTFSTKYAVGADILNQNGGFIDTITATSHTNGNPKTFPNFNEETQVILFYGEDRMGLVPLVSEASSGEQIVGSYGGSSGATVKVYRLTGSPGTVRVQSSASSGDGKRVEFFRFTKVGSNIVSSSVNEQTDRTYTLQASDFGKILKFTNSNLITLTVPLNLVIGFNCTVIHNGSGQITFEDNGGSAPPTSNYLYNRAGHKKTAGRYAVVKLTSCEADKFILSGDTGPS